MTPKKKEHVARHMLLLLRSSFVLPQLLTLNLFRAAALPAASHGSVRALSLEQAFAHGPGRH